MRQFLLHKIQGIKEDLMPAIQEGDQPMDVHFPSPSAPPAIEEAEDGADMNEDAAAAACIRAGVFCSFKYPKPCRLGYLEILVYFMCY